MTKLEAIIQPSRFGAIKAVLTGLGIGGLAVSGIRQHGIQKKHMEVYRGRKYAVDPRPKIKLEVVLPDELVDSALEAIHKTALNSSIAEDQILASKL